MRASKFLLPTRQDGQVSTGSETQNLLVRAGYLQQQASGIFTWLPAGTIVVEKIRAIVDRRMKEAGAQKIDMPIVQPNSLWEESGRDGYGEEMMRLEDRHGARLVLGPTHEELVTDIFRKSVTSYQQLPMNLYQTGRKFRDERRPRHGVVRAREFLMKDAYSFDMTHEGSIVAYQRMFATYGLIFGDLDLNAVPVRANSGEIGGDLSHEFVVPSEIGESEYLFDPNAPDRLEPIDNVLLDDDASLAAYFSQNASVYGINTDLKDCAENGHFTKAERALELGHIFNFGQKYTKALNASVMNAEGQKVFPYMGSYGIGVSRSVAAIADTHHDEHGPIWPNAVAPFNASVINLIQDNPDATAYADTLYRDLKRAGLDVILDDRNISAGKKLTAADLLGTPTQIIIGKRAWENGEVEIKDRATNKRTLVPAQGAVQIRAHIG